ncbi:MAG: MarR family transcriptional regulator [Betaproteobacteria bacterium]|nr:MarR family transcriptional regulator [Betaproteobacteria bacterium]
MDRLRNFGFLLAELHRRYVLLFEQLAQGTGLNLTTCRALAYLERHQGASQARLAELAGIEPMALVRVLDRLQADGLVRRQPDPTDRRAHRLELCEAAQPVLQRIRLLSQRAREQVFAGIETPEREQFLHLLERLADNLEPVCSPPPARRRVARRVSAAHVARR